MTLTEYLNLIKCDNEKSANIDEDKMSPEYMAKLEDRITQNQAKRKANKATSKIEDFING